MDAHHYAGDLFGAFRLEHLEALMPAHDIPRDLVPDDGIHIPEIVQGAPDFLVSRVTRLQVLAGIIFCRFQHGNGHFLNVYFRLYRWQKAHKINPFKRPGAIFCVPKKHFIFAKYFTAGRPGPEENAPGDSIPPGGRKADHAPSLLHGEVEKPIGPKDFFTAKRESRQRRRTFPRRSAKADNAAGLSLGEVRKPTAPPGLLHGEARKPTTPPGLLHGEVRKPTTAVAFARAGAFPAARPAGTARFLMGRGKGSFYEKATFRRRKVLFSSPFCGLLFCPGRAKLTVPAGKSPPPRNPGRPAAARPTTATGSRFSRRQRERPPRRPRPSPPAREGALGAPNDRIFSEGAFRKARKGKEKERRKPGWNAHPRFDYDSA